MTVKETQELVKIWEEKHGIHRNQLAGMAILTEAVGDLASVLAHNYTQINNKESQRLLSQKLGELLWEAISIANQNNIDLSSAIIETLESKNNK